MKNLRIAAITPEFVTEKYFSGGVANQFYRIFKSVVAAGHEVHLITLSDKNNDSFNYEGIQVHRLKVPPRGSSLQRWLNRLTRHRTPKAFRWLDFSFQSYRKLKQIHQQHPFDIVHFTNLYAAGLVTSLFLPIPYVVMVGSYSQTWHQESGEKRDLDVKGIEWLEWLQYRIAPYVYGPSYILKHILEEEAKIPNIKVIRTPIYIETEDWDDALYNEHLKGKSYLLFFGRYQLHKGFHILAQALPKVLATYPDLYVAFVGLDVPTKISPSMKDYALSINREYAERLVFLSQLPHQKLYPIIAGAKLVVLPSLIDNLPNTLMESMALGKPVIGTIGASFDELISEGENGFLVPIGDVDALARKIIEAWIHPNLEAIGQAAKRKAKELSPERTVQDLLNYYKEIITSYKK